MDPTHPTDEAIDYYLGPLVSSPQRKAQTNAYAIGLAPIRWLVLSRHLSGAPCRHESSGEQPITSFRRPVRTILTGARQFSRRATCAGSEALLSRRDARTDRE